MIRSRSVAARPASSHVLTSSGWSRLLYAGPLLAMLWVAVGWAWGGGA